MPKAAAATARVFTSSVGVPHENRHTLVALLNQRLADAADLHSQVKWAHWNVKGSDFIQLHELFDAIATRLEDSIDSLAERVTTLGGIANGTVRETAAQSGLKEASRQRPARLGEGIRRPRRSHHHGPLHATHPRTGQRPLVPRSPHPRLIFPL